MAPPFRSGAFVLVTTFPPSCGGPGTTVIAFVLVFPAFLSKYRYLAHKVVEEYFFPALCSFSVGQEKKRRFTVGWTSVITRCCVPYECIHEKLSNVFVVEKPVTCNCPEKLKLLNFQYPSAGFMPASKQEGSMKDEKAERTKTPSAVLEKKERAKRPDMQLYVPRALRGVEKSSVGDNVETESSSQKGSKRKSAHHSKSLKASFTVSSDNLPSTFQSEDKLENYVNLNIEIKNKELDSCDTTKLTSNENTVMKAMTKDASEKSISLVDSEVENLSSLEESHLSDNPQAFMSNSVNCNVNFTMHHTAKAVFTKKIAGGEKEIPLLENLSSNSEDIQKEESCSVSDSAPCNYLDLKIEETDSALESVSCSSAESISKAASPSVETMHPSSVDGSFRACDKSLEDDVLQSHTCNSVLSEDVDDSWESMFNDDGECLDEDFVKELSSVTGKIKIQAAKKDYSNFQPLPENVLGEYENIVELFNFPREFNTQDLVSAFSMFQQSSYSIKWVDDCHALAIFSTPTIANQALQLNHPFVKVRPISEGTKESKAKARWCARYSEPIKPRPATSAALARRLVSGALGLKVQATKEQRDYERSILNEAREKRKLKAKQKQAIWDGVVA